jgi:hypothetical protein
MRTKVAPRPGPGEETVTSPPWTRAILRAMVNPMPELLERRGCPGTLEQPEHTLKIPGGQPGARVGYRDLSSLPGRAGVGPHRQRASRVHGQGHITVGELGCQPLGRLPG